MYSHLSTQTYLSSANLCFSLSARRPSKCLIFYSAGELFTDPPRVSHLEQVAYSYLDLCHDSVLPLPDSILPRDDCDSLVVQAWPSIFHNCSRFVGECNSKKLDCTFGEPSRQEWVSWISTDKRGEFFSNCLRWCIDNSYTRIWSLNYFAWNILGFRVDTLKSIPKNQIKNLYS